jgi:hypothetical protein
MIYKIGILLTILTTSILPLMAQKNYNYDAAWQKVEKLMKDNLPKSALDEVNKIYTQSKKEGAGAQNIKALIYKSRLIQQVEENDWFKNILAFETEISTAKEPAKQILHSIAADLYWNYYQNKRYQLYSRTATVNFKKDDPETWTSEDFHRVILNHYEQSVANAALLQQTKLDAYDPLIIKGNQRNLRPTLFDLLAHKAIDYLKSDEPDITKPSYEFTLSDAAHLADFKTFINYNYQSKDSSSHELYAIRLYQQLLRFHASDNDKSALINADIERIEYAYSNSVNEYKTRLYKEALEHIYTQYTTQPEAMQAGYLLAVWWQLKGDNYSEATGIGDDKFAYQQAELICKEIIKKNPGSEGGINAAILLHHLQSPSISMEVEKVNTVAEPFRALVKFKNTGGIFLRVIKLTDDIETALNKENYNEQDAYWKKLAKLSALKNWQQNLPAFSDLREHSAEIKIDGLPTGKYIVAASAKKDFSTGVNVMSSTVFYISNISYINSSNQFFVLHRITGKPLANASVQLWNTGYDYGQRKQITSKGALLKTDKNGFVQLPENANADRYNSNTKVDITYNNDHLFISDNNFYSRSYNSPNEVQNRPDAELVKYFVFTDRAIYRPGQTVYFKAIGVLPHALGDANASGSSLYVTTKPITVELHNANGELVDTLPLIPNEYGSINGIFKLPATGLTGNFTVKINTIQYSAASFSVEEYKRPKFYVEYEKQKGSFTLNDTISITGLAKAYAGNNVDGAAVKYRVKRQTRFLYPWLFWGRGKMIWPPYHDNNEMEITNGETTTDADGKFVVRFAAIPDLSTSKLLDPTFDYTIEADVTDINGETRSESNTVSVGYKSTILNLEIPGGVHQFTDSLKTIGLSATNLAGEKLNAFVKVKIFALQTPQRLIRQRYWEAPDTTVLSYDEFIKSFPHDEYRNESDYHSWQKGKLLQSQEINTTTEQNIELKRGAYEAGYYVVEAISKDSTGQEVKAVEYFALTDLKKKQLPAPAYNIANAITATVEPGDKASFMQATSASDLFVVQQLSKAGKTINDKPLANFDFQTLDKDITIKTFETTEADRGGYSVKRFFIKDNRVYDASWFVNVPYTNKDLKISFETFRDKLLPGQDETWKVKISGHKGETVAAEMLAGMYDASLDQFAPHAWEAMHLWRNNSFNNYWNARNNFTNISSTDGAWNPFDSRRNHKDFDDLITVNNIESFNILYTHGGFRMLSGRAAGVSIVEDKMVKADMAPPENLENENKVFAKFTPPKIVKDEEVKEDDKPAEEKKEPKNNSTVQIRKNFNETAFFFPTLHTSDSGVIEFSFTIPEALTQWKLQTLAHTKDLSTAMATRTIITQKQLMVQPNAPRFFRQGDSLVLVTKIVNLSDSALSGEAELQLIDPATMQPVAASFNIKNPVQQFTAAKGQSVAVNFPFNIPLEYNGALMYRIVAKAGSNSDGEEMALPVLTNRMLVTESFPINLRHTNTKHFNWEKLLQSGNSKSLQNQALTVEYTSNPAWYAIQSLPYLMEYPYDCAEQTWNRFYANALASKIASSMPKIKAVFETWKNLDTAALMSNLQKNEELKSILLEETPWVLQAKSESEQKKNIALLFDMVRMSSESAKAIGKLQELQSDNGGFVWFKGGPDDRYMTQYILTGIGHLKQLDAWPASQINTLNKIIAKAVPYLDARLKDDYDYLVKYKADLKKNNLSSIAIQWLYMRSFFDAPVAAATKTAYDYYSSQAKKYWMVQAKYEQGMIALALHRTNDALTPKAILKSLTENSITSEEFGMYWKEFNTGGYYWWQAPVESHALLIEAYSEIEKNTTRVDDLKTWLLKQKQTQNWQSTKATAEACYVLLLQGNNWLNSESSVTIQLGNQTISPAKTEAGTGYFKQTVEGKDIKPAMGNITVTNTPINNSKNSSTSWGSVYWQYFEDLDKITAAATPMSLKKQLFIVRNSDRGPVITPVNDNDVLKVGDKVKVRIELRSDRNLEYVHVKDMRAACFEPVNVLSSYKYQDGLGYYESTRDASTNFFISYLNKGTYVFEYDLLVTHTGNFSNGISSIQCMYAPEFTSHSEGIRVTVK